MIYIFPFPQAPKITQLPSQIRGGLTCVEKRSTFLIQPSELLKDAELVSFLFSILRVPEFSDFPKFPKMQELRDVLENPYEDLIEVMGYPRENF